MTTSAIAKPSDAITAADLAAHKRSVLSQPDGERLIRRNAKLRGVELSGADLRLAEFSGCDMRWANFRRSDLRKADLRATDLRGADFTGSDMQRADMRGAWLAGAQMRGADLRCTDLRGAFGVIDGGIIDGYRVILVRHSDESRIAAGCRWFTIAEARAHWSSPEMATHSLGPQHGPRMLEVLELMLEEARQFDWTI